MSEQDKDTRIAELEAKLAEYENDKRWLDEARELLSRRESEHLQSVVGICAAAQIQSDYRDVRNLTNICFAASQSIVSSMLMKFSEQIAKCETLDELRELVGAIRE